MQNSLRDTAWRNVAVAQITDTSFPVSVLRSLDAHESAKAELVDPVDLMLGNATEHISQPALGIDFVELRRLDKSNRESVNE